MSVPSSTARLPLRIRLTVVLVILVAGVSAIVGASSYRILRRSLEADAREALVASAQSLADATSTAIDFKQRRVQTEVRSIELACGVSGVMAPSCARDMLRRFIRTEHALGARLFYRKSKLTMGDFTPTTPAPYTGFLIDSVLHVRFSAFHSDNESGLALAVEFPAEDLAADKSGHLVRFVAVRAPDHVVSLGPTVATDLTLLNSGPMQRCLSGHPQSATIDAANGDHQIAEFIPLARVPGACAATIALRSQTLAPATRWRSRMLALVTIAALSGIIVAFLIAWVITRPVSILRKRVQAFRRGDFESPVPLVGGGELLELSEAFARMAESINTSRAALIDSENRLRLAYKAARLWMWEQNLVTGTIYWHDPDSGRAQEPQSFRSLLRIVHPEDRHALCNAIRTAKITGNYQAEYRRFEAGVSTVWISSWGKVVESRRGKPRTMVGVSLDVTSRKQTDAMLIEQQKLTATSEMAATLAHEINNPLTSVIGAIYMASGSPSLPSETQKYLRIAQDESRRVAQIARQILSLYRKPGAPEILDIKYLWEEVIASRTAELTRRHVRVSPRIFSTRIFGYREELRHAFAALLTNSLEYAPPNTTIKVHVRPSRSYLRFGEKGARITIADCGPGVPHDQRSLIFEPFTSAKPLAASGLGLWTTRAAVLKHGGTIRVRSVTRGKTGTFISVFLPARCPSPSA